MMKPHIIIFLLFLPLFLYAADLDYGLLIKSYPYRTSEMSSLVLEGGNSVELGEEVTISFDMFVRNDNVFGNVFRIITNKEENIDLLFTVGDADKRYPILVVNESVYPISQEIIREQWIPVKVILSSRTNTIEFALGDTEQTVSYTLSKSGNFKMSFGLCPFPGFTLFDVASVNIKNVRLYKKDKLSRYWKLEKHHKELCYDSLRQVPAIATNPYWLIDDHISWTKIYETKLTETPSVTYNPASDDFFIVSDSKEILVFNARNSEQKVIKVAGGLYAANSPNQLLYLAENNSLLSYNLDENIYSFFSFDTNQWSNQTPNTKEHSYWNNSVMYNPADHSIVSFGGYGFYKYNNELIKKYPFANKANEKNFLAEISPRYAAGTVIVDNTLYIFGGRGNKSGRQELFPKNYYDFYAVNLQTNQVNKLWEVTDVGGAEFISGENLIYNPEDHCFYIFTTKAGGTLLKVTAEKPLFEPMSLPIDKDIEAQFLYVNLYYSPIQKKLFALINKTGVDNESEITIYSISYPPVSVADLSQQAPSSSKDSAGEWEWIAIITLILSLVVAGIYFYFLTQRGKNRGAIPESIDIPADENAEKPKEHRNEINHQTLQTKLRKEKEETHLQHYFDFSKQSICFLGGFHVRDKSGEDITSLFTPTLKALLILLTLYTGENPRGISGKKMLQLLWSDKNESSARNNRNVYLSKLRTVLEKIGDIDIATESGFWSIKFGNGVICDYTETMRYFAILKENHLHDEDQFNKLLELLLRGTLLPNTEIDWIDRFKSDFSNLTIDSLSSLLTGQDNISNHLILKIAETLFQHDFINEDALHIKCKILSESGKMGLAKSFYDTYCKEYYNLLGTEYKYSLAEVLKGENLKA